MKLTRQTTLVLLLMMITAALNAQTTVKGIVTSPKGEPLTGVNIYLENSIDGTVSDAEGHFSFKTDMKGDLILIAGLLGFETCKKAVNLEGTVELTIELRETVNALNAVTITAGSYEASDKKRTAVMEPLDIYTTAGAVGDVTGAFRTLPGSQPAPEEGRLLVRGGEAYETKTYMDGLLVSNPYNSKVPDLPTRGRFSPSLFSGTSFNTGGYSAEYGQALSSVMLLNTTDLENKASTRYSLMSLGSEINHTWITPRSSMMAGANYFNMKPYQQMTSSHMNWIKPVESGGMNLMYRHQTKEGILKAFVTGDKSSLSFGIPENNETKSSIINNKTGNIYSNVTYRESLTSKVSYMTGMAASADNNNITINNIDVSTNNLNLETRFKLMADITNNWKLTSGMSDTYNHYKQNYQNQQTSVDWHGDVNQHIAAIYVEPEYRPSPKFTIRGGLRTEYSSLLNKVNVAPRLSAAYKTGDKSQVSVAYGDFFQMAENDYLTFNNHLLPEKASHLIASFQAGDNSTRMLRAEAYLKHYDRLVCYDAENATTENAYNNQGYGYAQGFDFFIRDKKSLKHTDIWLSYSYIDTKRLYRYYSEEATPTYIANHTLNLVTKYFVPTFNSQISGTYTYASGKPFHNTQKTGLMNDRTPYYSDLTLSWSYITQIKNNLTIIYFSVSNVLGRDNIYGYRTMKPTGGSANQMVAIKPDQKRFFFVGIFFNLL